MAKTVNAKIVIRNNTAANLAAANPVLLKGEMGLETDTSKFKFGDGVTAWNALEYYSSAPASSPASIAVVSSLNNLPITANAVIATITAAQTISFSTTPPNGWRQTIFIRNNTGSLLDVFFPSGSIGYSYSSPASVAARVITAMEVFYTDNIYRFVSYSPRD